VAERPPGEPVIGRHVGVDPIPATAWATAVFAGRTPAESRTVEQQAALALAAALTDELAAADALLLRQEAEAQARRHGRELGAAVVRTLAA
jgi:FMN-dependent NADH-azoreductase